VIPLTRLVREPVLADGRVRAELVDNIRAGGVRETERAGLREELEGDVDATLELQRGEEPREDVDRLDARENPRPRRLDLNELLRVQEEHHVDDHVGLHDRSVLEHRAVRGEVCFDFPNAAGPGRPS
jgi:hypothetical protein